MAYDAKGLQIDGGFGATGTGTDISTVMRRALYRTADAAAVVEAANYFNAAAPRLTKGTVITAAMAVNGTPVLKQYMVTVSDGVGAVTIALQATAAG